MQEDEFSMKYLVGSCWECPNKITDNESKFEGNCNEES